MIFYNYGSRYFLLFRFATALDKFRLFIRRRPCIMVRFKALIINLVMPAFFGSWPNPAFPQGSPAPQHIEPGPACLLRTRTVSKPHAYLSQTSRTMSHMQPKPLY